jgi:hypothetical protein
MALDLACKQVLLGLWPYCCEEFLHVVRSLVKVNTCFYERASVPEAAQGGFEEKLGCWSPCATREKQQYQ